MASSPSTTRPWFQVGQARRYIAETIGADTANPSFNPAISEMGKRYQKDAAELTLRYTEIQDLATDVLESSTDEQTRKDVIYQLADFCMKIHDIDSGELYVLTSAGRKNALVALLQLERELRENANKEFDDLDDNLKDKLRFVLEFSFSSMQPAGSAADDRQIGTSFMYSMLPVLSGIDMGNNPVITICEAKNRANIPLTAEEKSFLDRYQYMKDGHQEIKTVFTAKEINRYFDGFVQQSAIINKDNNDANFAQNKLKLSCDLLNNIRGYIHTKNINYVALYNLIDNEQIKTVIDCINFCEQGDADKSYEAILKEVDTLSKDVSFACKAYLHAYGYKVGSLDKYFDAYNVSLNGLRVTWGTSEQAKEETDLLRDKVADTAPPAPTKKHGSTIKIVEPMIPVQTDIEANTDEPSEQLDDNIDMGTNNNIPANEAIETTQKEIAENDVATGDQDTKQALNDTVAVKEQAKVEEPTSVTHTVKHGRKPATIQGWLYHKIKQAYLSDENTTEEMKAKFANMTHQEQLELLRREENKHYIQKEKDAVRRAINKYDTLSYEQQKEVAELSEGYDYFGELLANKKEEIRIATEKHDSEIRERAQLHKEQQRAEKKRFTEMSEEEKAKFDINTVICEIKYQTALGALTKNGNAFFQSLLSSELDKQGITRVLTDAEITSIKFDTLYRFIQTASDVMLKKDVTPYMLTTEEVKETEQFKEATKGYIDNEENNVAEFFNTFGNRA